MGGRIDVSSTLGVGSTFSVRLPVESFGDVYDEQTAGLEGIRALVVDDLDVSRRMIEDELRRMGADVVGLADVSALSACAHESGADERYGILVVDADRRATTQLAALFKRKAFDNAKVILLALDEQQARGVDGRDVTVLTKPVRTMTLRKSVSRLFGKEDGVQPARRRTTDVLVARRVLVVDDDETNRRVLESFAKREGCVVTFAEDGLKAVSSCKDQAFDVVFMDLSMPYMDGNEAARAIRANETAAGQPGVPIVCLTAHAMAQQRQQAIEAGMDDFVVKPVRRQEFVSALNRWCPATTVAVPEGPPSSRAAES